VITKTRQGGAAQAHARVAPAPPVARKRRPRPSTNSLDRLEAKLVALLNDDSGEAVLRHAGNREAALAAYREAVVIAEKLVAADPGKVDWQDGLAISHASLGGVQFAAGNHRAALNSYLEALGIRERLASADPGNAERQRDLSDTHGFIGDVQFAVGDREAALDSYVKALFLCETLVAADPGNVDWQRDLGEYYIKIIGIRSIDESNNPGYTRTDMDNAAAFAAAARTFSERELKEYVQKGEVAAAVLRERETTSRSATATPRLKWDTDRLPDENPATFAWRAYAAEAKAGTLHRGVIYSEDRELHRRLNSWLRSHPMPEGIDIPAKPEWNTRQLAKLGDDAAAQEVIRLVRVATRRAERAKHPHM
jgi:tetratricopeptide (TPR) repeat protein